MIAVAKAGQVAYRGEAPGSIGADDLVVARGAEKYRLRLEESGGAVLDDCDVPASPDGPDGSVRWELPLDAAAANVATCDVDGDGASEIVVPSADGHVCVLGEH